MKKSIIAATVLLAGSLFAQNPVQDFVKGQSFLRTRKYQQAAETFNGVAENSKGELKTKALLYKAIALGRDRKVSLDEALKAAGDVPAADLKAYAEMSILYSRNQWKRIVSEFAGADIGKWDEDYAYIGWTMRGVSYVNQKQYAKGIADLLPAIKNAGADQGICLEAEGALFQAYCQSKKYEEAVAVIERIRTEQRSLSGSYLYLGPVLASMDAFIPLKKFDEAHRILAELDKERKLSASDNIYGCRYFLSLGKVYQAEGKTGEAKEAFRKAANCKNAHKYYRDLAQKALDSLK